MKLPIVKKRIGGHVKVWLSNEARQRFNDLLANGTLAHAGYGMARDEVDIILGVMIQGELRRLSAEQNQPSTH